MMNLFFAAVLSLTVHAEDQAPDITSWKAFRSDYGYGFRYPSKCWEVKIDNPDAAGAVTAAKNIAALETDSCARPRLDPNGPNGISISGGWEPLKSRKESLRDLEKAENWIKVTNKNDVLAYRKFKLGDNDAIGYVSKISKDEIGWTLMLYCSSEKISIHGPSVNAPSPSYFDKFKSGDLALPEPEKTIIESIRCIERKAKEEKQSRKAHSQQN